MDVFPITIIIENIAFFALYWHFCNEMKGIVEIRYRYTSFRKVSNELERVLQKSGSTFTREQTLIPSSPMDMREDQQMDVFRRLIEIFENVPNVGEIRALTRNFQ